ncbi:uncharacterized protein FOMMEDRAFT_156930 [Fomitiporia mediterranea MF3/22]|uniref:uncharacterized protein n=1 Tax=Fomitiporia mediterranea (strain MF3/22) TaxID=694068 RepID=UPI0004408158|nr:uncharacterized protein FOMMEDRAFT_156930 [Fomitiporia mediterranea MF3/22]EJD01803.1 hypothetical protein FOMMEDRAFT_156930 [Fomitiporia mediterranea MF3/22]
MDIVASVCSSIAACTAEREECMELLKKSFSVGQQCGCVNANANREASVKQEGQRRRGNANGGARSGRDERQKVGRRWMSNYCAGYYEVDRLLTLYVEGWCSQLGGIIACDLRLSAGIAMADWRDKRNVFRLTVAGRVSAGRTLASVGLD